MDWTTGIVEYWNGGILEWWNTGMVDWIVFLFYYLSCCIFPVVFTPTYLASYSFTHIQYSTIAHTD